MQEVQSIVACVKINSALINVEVTAYWIFILTGNHELPLPTMSVNCAIIRLYAACFNVILVKFISRLYTQHLSHG